LQFAIGSIKDDWLGVQLVDGDEGEDDFVAVEEEVEVVEVY